MGLVGNLRLRTKQQPAAYTTSPVQPPTNRRPDRRAKRGYEVRDEPSAGHNRTAPSTTLRHDGACPNAALDFCPGLRHPEQEPVLYGRLGD